MDRIGLIGIGLVGTALAERLLAAGYGVVGYDIKAEQRETLARLGGEAVCCASAVAACDRIFLSLPTSDIASAVLDEIAVKLKPGALIIDTTTGAPEAAAAFADRLGQSDYIDATVAGSSQLVRSGNAIFICGGTEAAFARCADLFEHCCARAFHVGPPGSGARMKLVVNLVLGLNRAVLAEGLEFARASGIDPYQALEILKATPAYSRAMDAKGMRMLNEDFEPEARLSQHLKDVRLILESGARSGAQLPLSTVHKALLEAAEQLGFGPRDNSAVIKAFRNGST